MLQLMNQLVIPLALMATVSHANAKALAHNLNLDINVLSINIVHPHVNVLSTNR